MDDKEAAVLRTLIAKHGFQGVLKELLSFLKSASRTGSLKWTILYNKMGFLYRLSFLKEKDFEDAEFGADTDKSQADSATSSLGEAVARSSVRSRTEVQA